MSKSDDDVKAAAEAEKQAAAAAEAEKQAAAAAEAEKQAAAAAEAKKQAAAAASDNGQRPLRPAKIDKSKVKVLSKGKTAQVVTDGTHVWKEALK